MLLNVVGFLLIGVLGVVVTFVHELAFFHQHLGGGTNLISGSVQQLPQKLDVTSFSALGEKRTSLGIVAPSTIGSVSRCGTGVA